MVSLQSLTFGVILSLDLIHSQHAMECGTRSLPTKRIVGGYDAQKGTWPWMVSFSYIDPLYVPGVSGHICGGVLLHLQWVLTAAHCLDSPQRPNVFPSYPLKQWRVVAGMHARNGTPEDRQHWQTRRVKRFIYRKDFRDNISSSVHDIALIQVTQAFIYTTYVRPVCLPAGKMPENGWSRCYAAGWGKKSENATRYALTLQEVPILLVNQMYCRNIYPNKYVAGQHICGGDWYHGNKDTCKGDSGGPLACQSHSGNWYVAGIISWGLGCGRKQILGVYTNVAAYEKWIKNMIRHYQSLESPASPSKSNVLPTTETVNNSSGVETERPA